MGAILYCTNEHFRERRSCWQIWSEGIFHSELLRKGGDQTMTIDPCKPLTPRVIFPYSRLRSRSRLFGAGRANGGSADGEWSASAVFALLRN
jgi:hypothetical protein